MDWMPFKVHSVLPEHLPSGLEKASKFIHLLRTLNNSHYPLVLIGLTLPPPVYNAQIRKP